MAGEQGAPDGLGAALRSLRNRRQLSLEAVATRLGISLSSLAMYERGERMPPLPRLQQLAQFYGVSLDQLLGRSGDDGARRGRADEAGRASGAAAGLASGAAAALEPRLENLPQFLRATGEVSEDLIRQIMALIRLRRGG